MDNCVEDASAMSVVLGGKPWAVPVLSARQNKIIDPLILGLLPVFGQWQNDKAGALAHIGQVQYDALLDIAFVAISRKQPDLTREQFLELPITLPELICAFNVIAQQTGIFQKETGENAPGEALGA